MPSIRFTQDGAYVVRNDRTGVIVEISDRNGINGVAFWRNGKDGIATFETAVTKTGAKVEQKFASDGVKVEGVGKQDTKGSSSALQTFGGRTVNDLLSAAVNPINKEGLTEAARALTKHASGQRSTGTFPKLSGGIEKQNAAAQEIVNEILKNPASTYKNLGRGGLEVRAPDGRGLRFNSDGSFSGFLDPKVQL